MAADMPLLVASANSSSERRITPAWSIAHLKTRLEPITGIPASAQKLRLRIGSQDPVAIEAANEEATQLASFPLQAYAEIYVSVFRYRTRQDQPQRFFVMSSLSFLSLINGRMVACHMCCLAELRGPSMLNPGSWNYWFIFLEAIPFDEVSAA